MKLNPRPRLLLCSVSLRSLPKSYEPTSSSASSFLFLVRAPAPCLVSLASRHITFLQFVCATRLFHCLSPSSACWDSPAVTSSQLCSAQPAVLYACHTPPSFRRAFGTLEWSFWSRLSRGRARNPALRNLLSFVLSARRRPASRALLWSGKYRSPSPNVPIASCRVPPTRWSRRVSWRGSGIHTGPRAGHCPDILLAAGSSLNSLLLCWLPGPRIKAKRHWFWLIRCLLQPLRIFFCQLRMTYWLKWACRTLRVKIHLIAWFILMCLGLIWSILRWVLV